jgi:hypothetical protein
MRLTASEVKDYLDIRDCLGSQVLNVVGYDTETCEVTVLLTGLNELGESVPIRKTVGESKPGCMAPVDLVRIQFILPGSYIVAAVLSDVF